MILPGLRFFDEHIRPGVRFRPATSGRGGRHRAADSAERVQGEAGEVRVARVERGAQRGGGGRVADPAERSGRLAPHVVGRSLVREGRGRAAR